MPVLTAAMYSDCEKMLEPTSSPYKQKNTYDQNNITRKSVIHLLKQLSVPVWVKPYDPFIKLKPVSGSW